MGKKKEEYIGIPEYAKKIGQTPEWIRRLIARGKIQKKALNKKGKRWLVNPEKADVAREKNLSYMNRKKKTSKKSKQNDKPNQNSNGDKELSIDEKIKALEQGGITLNKDCSLADAQRIDAYYKALLRKREYEKNKRELIEVLKIEKNAFECGRQIRDQFLSIPERLSAILASEQDQFECRAILLKEITSILDGLHDALRVDKAMR